MISDFYGEVGKRIQAVRKARRFTQETLAAKTDISRTSIASIEIGAQRVMIDDLLQIADALGVMPAELFSGATVSEFPRELAEENDRLQAENRRLARILRKVATLTEGENGILISDGE